jgi:glutamyl-tRNA reductase
MSALIFIGLNHTIAPVEVRERLAFGPERLPAALTALRAELTAAGACGCADGAAEVAILSTCNRTEVYAWAGGDAEAIIRRRLAAQAGGSVADLAPYLQTYCGEEAARHLLTVAAGLDSLVLGENEILGQVKMAAEAAQAAAATGPLLSTLFRFAIQAGKRVRAETEIGRAALSAGTISVDLARETFGEIADRTALLIGAGKMGSIAGQALVRAGLRCVLVANRSFDRAARLAERLGGRAVHFDALAENLATADIVICSTAAPHIVLHADDIRCALAARSQGPDPCPLPPDPCLLVIDLAVPRDVDPAVAQIPGVRLAAEADFERLVRERHPLALAARQAAEAIIAEEAQAFAAWHAARRCLPTIQALRSRAEAIRQAETEKTLRRLGDLPPEKRAVVEALGQAIVNKLLHSPLVRLKEPPPGIPAAEYAELAETLFGLD